MAQKNRKSENRPQAAATGNTALPGVPFPGNLPGYGVPLILAGLALAFFLPFLLSGKMIYGSDVMNGLHNRFFYSEFVRSRLAMPWWMPNTLSGMPTLDAFFGDMLFPLALLQFIFPLPVALGMKYLAAVMMTGLFMFLFLNRALGLRRDVSLLGAVCWMFNTEFVSHMFPGHDGKMFVISLLPLSLYALKRLLDDRTPRYAVLLALSIGLCLLTSHVQTTYFSLWGIFFYFVFETVRAYLGERRKKALLARSGLFALAVGLGLCIGMVQFLPPYQFTHAYSVRGEGDKTSYEHAVSWSIHPEEAASLIVPEFCGFSDKEGGQEGPRYWGRNPFKLNNEYSGIVVLVCAILFLILFRRDPMLLFFAGLALFSLIFALGGNTPFFYLFYHLVPGVKLFRAPSMIMFWFSLSVTVMAAWGLNRLFTEAGGWAEDKKQAAAKKALVVAAVLAGLVILSTLGKEMVLGLWRGIFYSSMGEDKAAAFMANYPSFLKGAWLALLFGGGSLMLVRLFVRDGLKKQTLIVLLCVIALLDLFRVDAYFYKLVDSDEYVNRNDPVLTGLASRQKEAKFRVLPVPGHLGDNDAQLNGLESVLGFHDNEISWYREFTGGQSRENLFFLLKQGKIEGNPFLDLLNVRYVLFRQGRGGPLGMQENPGGRERAWVASDFEVVPEAAINARIRSEGFPYRRMVLLETAPPSFLTHDTTPEPAGMVTRLDYDGSKRVYDIEMKRPGFLMLSEVYMPYWKARESGKELVVLKTDIALMSVPLTAGKHTVVMTYESPWIRIGARVSLGSLVLCLLLFLFSKYYLERKKTVSPV